MSSASSQRSLFFGMILSEHGVDSLNPVSFGRPEECGRLLLTLRDRPRWPLIFVSGPSGVGKRGLIRLSLVQKLQRLHPGNHLPVQISVPVSTRDSATSIAKHCIRAVLANHPGFRRRSSYEVLGKQLAILAESDPVGVGRRLCALLQGLERGTSGLTAIKLVIVVEGLDNLFEDRKRCEDKTGHARKLIGTGDSLGFFREMMGARSVLFSFSYRTWVGDVVREVVSQSRIDESDIYFCELDYPCRRNTNAAVAAQVNETFLPDTPRPKLKKLAHVIREDLYEAPQCLSLLPRLLDRLQDEADSLGKSVCSLDYTGTECLAGFVCNLAEEIFLMKDVSRQAIWEELFREASKSGDYSLQASELAKDTELWNLALELTDWRLFTIEGNSLEEAVFHPIHDALYHKWERAKRWLQEEKPSLAAVRQFDEYAISWEVSNRSQERLLEDKEKLESASNVLRDREVKRLLSPLTADYLRASLRRMRRERNLHLATIGTGIAAVLGLIALVAGVTFYNLSDRGIGIASVIPPDSKWLSPSKAVKPAVANLPRVETIKKKVQKSAGSKGEKGKVSPGAASKSEGILLSDAEIDEAIFGKKGPQEEEAVVSTLTETAPFPSLPDRKTQNSTIDKSKTVNLPTEVVDPNPLLLVEDENPAVVDDEKMRDEVAKIAAISLNEEASKVLSTSDAFSEPVHAAVDTPIFDPLGVNEQFTEHIKVKLENPHFSAEILPRSDAREVIEMPNLELASIDPTSRKVVSPKPVESSPVSQETKMVEPQEPEVPEVRPLSFPDGMDENTAVAKVIESLKGECEEQDVESVIKHLTLLHDQNVDGVGAAKSGSFSADLAMSLGKIARKQSDSKAVEKSWKLGFAGGGAQAEGSGISKDLRLLMARIAQNAGREREASLFLSRENSKIPISKDDLIVAAAVIDWHYGDVESARKGISKISHKALKASTIDPSFIPGKLGGDTMAGGVGETPEG